MPAPLLIMLMIIISSWLFIGLLMDFSDDQFVTNTCKITIVDNKPIVFIDGIPRNVLQYIDELTRLTMC